jgi:Sulfotransferase family
MLTKRHEQELTEIHSLASELNRSVKASLAELERVRDTDNHAEVNPPAGRNGDRPLLVFVHIPKTAGGTVSTMFAAAYSKAEVHKAGNFMREPEKTARKVGNWHQKGGRVSVGHVPYGVFREYMPEDALYMTFLREPVDRVLSHYYRHHHILDPRRVGRSVPQPWTPEQGKVKAESLEQALLELRLPQLSNLATRFLSDETSMASELSEDALEQAEANLRKFAFVGVQERFEESVERLRTLLRLGPVPYQNRHVSQDRPGVDDISDAERELILEHNRLDVKLYRFGLELFEEAGAAPGQ